METNNEIKVSPTASMITTILFAAIFNTVLGLGAGILYATAASFSNVGLPVVGLGPLLALWWAYGLVVLVPIILFVILYRATDPIFQLTPPKSK